MAEKRKSEFDIETDDPVISLQDIIDEDHELETTANAVLGGSNDQECTYSDGYVPRQALYACATCETTSAAGVCLACSLECHDGHELYELYTKRNFRCDCGNSKFSFTRCKLHPDKDSENDRNVYNHNFSGTYCACKRPYPDPEDDVDDEMIQCIVCEDWWHSRHLKGKGIPESFGFAEMICHLCMSSDANILWYYNWEYTPHETSVVDVDGSDVKTEIILDKEKPLASVAANCGEAEERQVAPLKVTLEEHGPTSEADSATSEADSAKNLPPVEGGECTGSREKTNCILARLMRTYEACRFPDSAAFWPEGWRDKLCKCSRCSIKMKNISFLFSKEDTVADYEEKGVGKYPESSMSSGMRALGGMNRIQQVEVIQGYNDMKAKLSEFLETFARESKVVTEQDIRNFFQRMNESKRPKFDIPHSCK